MKKLITEADFEENVMDVLREIGYETIQGDGEEYLPEGVNALRDDYKDVVLTDRLRSSLKKINPDVPREATEEAVKIVTRSGGGKLAEENEKFHEMLTDGLDVPVRTKEGQRHKKVLLLDFENPENNDFLAVNQFTIVEGKHERRPDVILFINGLPLVVMELKNPADEKATMRDAYNQFQTYMEQIPSLFRFNEILIISDGIHARAGTITSERERFMQWKTIDGDKPRKGTDRNRNFIKRNVRERKINGRHKKFYRL